MKGSIVLRITGMALLFTAGCMMEQTGGPALNRPGTTPMSVTGPQCQDGGVGDQIMPSHPFLCGKHVLLSGNVSGIPNFSSVLAEAASDWNDGVLNQYNLPTFVTTGTGDYTITFNQSGSGSLVCGVNSGLVVTLMFVGTGVKCGDGPYPYTSVSVSNPSQVAALVAHEIGHVLGFQKHLKDGLQTTIDNDPYVSHCIMVVPSTMNNSVCEYERQIVYLAYRLQNNDPNVNLPFAYSLNPSPSSVSLGLGGSATVTVTQAATNGEGAPITLQPSDVVTWDASGVTPAGAFSVSPTTGQSVQIQAGNVTGSGAITATLSPSTGRFNVPWPVNTAVPVSNPVTPPPTNLAVSSVTSSQAVVTWTAGDPNATTTVQNRLSGAQAWSTVGSAAAGVTTYTIPGLSACTTYDVAVYHVKNGIPSTTTTLLNGIHTTAASGACAPTNFTVVSCVDSQFSKKYMFLHTSWVRKEFSAGSTTDVAANTTNNTATADILQSFPSSTTTALLGEYVELGTYNEYFWVRHKTSGGTPSAWVPLDANPVNPPAGCGGGAIR